jgi:hypothetical protein
MATIDRVALPPRQSSAGRGYGPPPRARALAGHLRPTGSEQARYFDVAMLAGLPPAAQRWLSRAVDPGMLLVSAVELKMHGEIRLGRWRRFTAVQALVPDSGFVWAARTRVAGLRVSGYDSYVGDAGEMRWRALGLLPVQTASGPDVTRSAAGRLAAESVLLPTSLVRATWLPGDDPGSATFVRRVGRLSLPVHIDVAADGRLLRVSMQRWGDPDGVGFAQRGFEVLFEREFWANGITVPDGLRAAWLGEDGEPAEFFRAVIDSADFFTPDGAHDAAG